jgi:hypothetical protein
MIRELLSSREIRSCVELYMGLNDPSFIPLEFDVCYNNLLTLVKRKKFVRGLFEDDELIAWIYCDVVEHLHLGFPVFQQLYYASDQKGMKAYRCVVRLHEAMLVKARESEFSLAVSSGSHMDPDHVFAKILEKQGWERRGYLCLRHL